MRDIGNEVAADGFQAADARQILHQQEASACVLIGNDNQTEGTGGAPEVPPDSVCNSMFCLERCQASTNR